MSIRQTWDTCYLCWFSKPKAERPLYQFVRRHAVRSIVELGLSSEARSLALVRLAQRVSPGQEVRYVGIDLFDARPSHLPKLTLKQMHQAMNRSGATARLIPGDSLSGLARCIHQIQGMDLMIISADQDAENLSKAWLHIPRVLSAEGKIFQSAGPSSIEVRSLHLLTAAEIEQHVQQAQRSRRAAA